MRRVPNVLNLSHALRGPSAFRDHTVASFGFFASQVMFKRAKADIATLRNIGISAHIDSGKTTLTERILFYTGRIREIHEVKGKDGKGATMDYMDLEREKGITIQSAATYCTWKKSKINIIDTPGHVDFTIEVERALRVLDGAILVLCGVSGVQSQTMTVDRQMRRYDIPRLVFVNKLDRAGADPFKVAKQLRDKLKLNCSAVQIPIGLESNHQGIIDIIDRTANYFLGESGVEVLTEPVPERLVNMMEEKRMELLERLANVDEELAELLVMDQEISPDKIREVIRRQTIARKFIPLFMGSAFKNKGVQLLLDGVINYLPNPMEKVNKAFDVNQDNKEVILQSQDDKPLVAYAFKLEEGRFGQLTFMRIYQGMLKKTNFIKNAVTSKSTKVARLVRIHSNQMEDITEASAGEICAMFGVDCPSGTTFTDYTIHYTMSSMHVPKAVISLAVTPKERNNPNFAKALSKFQREDPTFRMEVDPESNETIIRGMGELHLEIYLERMRREYDCDVVAGKPRVAFRETISKKAKFDHTLKKQTGGAGQYAKVIGYIEPIEEDEGLEYEFVNAVIGNAIPPEYIEACRKGFFDMVEKGPLIGNKVLNVRMVIIDGASHSVDSSEKAFRAAIHGAFRTAVKIAEPTILEPIMKVEVQVPHEFAQSVTGGVLKRKGDVEESSMDEAYTTIRAFVPLNNMFGYSTELRSFTQGKGEFTMEYFNHAPVTYETQKELTDAYEKELKAEKK